ncbi:glutathione S-transferase family protein [Vitiosangium sp. GDMCC 1.1324]|uniref:glutathione S-transferase family protein n=1 Tax=Vitiosangium sp. (strain GDMCC 1.1324) TaxID=2138576 RepID=UPI000D361658|nr:glutathione S-transferase family protein [Vitiosangium sp. GDMCC 1.1324]PTL83788.1 glutathione S-transferase [Vitiosangium sp. GDMCC 1.1324]
MLRLHDYLPSANGYKIRLLLHQLERPYELVPVDIFSGESRTEAFLQKNPDGRIPVLELEPGRFLAESNAILLYLAEGTPFLPDDRYERAQVLQWLFFEQNGVEPNIGSVRFWVLTGRAAGRAEALRLKMEQGHSALAALERHLKTRTFLVNERYTLADIALYAYTHVAPEAGIDLEHYPAVRAWLRRVEAQPRYIEGPAPYTPNAHVSAPAAHAR